MEIYDYSTWVARVEADEPVCHCRNCSMSRHPSAFGQPARSCLKAAS